MANRYYVGNSGAAATWNNANYWSSSSGGAGGAGVPSGSDDVIFDSNSPACEIDIDTEAASLTATNCGNITQSSTVSSSNTYPITLTNVNWTVGAFSLYATTFTASGTGTFNTNGSTFVTGDASITSYVVMGTGNWFVGGSFALASGKFTKGSGTITTGNSSTVSLTLDAQGNDIGNFVYDGTGGTVDVTLLSSVTFGTLELTNVDFDCNTFSIGCTGAVAIDATGKTIAFSTGNHTFKSNFTVTAGTLTFGTGSIFTISNDAATASLNFGSGTSLKTVLVDASSTGFVTFAETCTIETLTLNPGNNIKFQSTKNFTITNRPVWKGTSGSNILLKASTDTSAWNLLGSWATAAYVSYINVRDSNSTPVVNAIDSTNSTGNTNWNFISDPATRYFVSDGATTSWQEPNNWAYISNGAGGAGVPTASTAVYFDTNSGKNCVLNSNAVASTFNVSSYGYTLNINGKTLTISDAATITSGTFDLTTGTIQITTASTIVPTAVTAGTGKWYFPLTTNITCKFTSTINIGVVDITGGNTYTMTIDKYTINGGLKCNTLSSTCNLTTLANVILDSTITTLSNLTLTSAYYTYFRGNTTFSGTMTIGSGGTYYLGSGTFDLAGVTLSNVSSITTSQTMVFSAAWNCYGTFTLHAGSTVSFGSGLSYNFNTIVWNGSLGNPITLASLGTWYLDVDATSPTVTYIVVSNSNASIGNQILANDGTSANLGGNSNWLFASSSSSSSSSSFSSSSVSSSSVSSSSFSSSSYSSSSFSSSSYSSSSFSSSSFSSSSFSSSSYSSCSSSFSSSSFSSSSISSSSSSFSSSSFSSCSSSSSSVSGSSFFALTYYSSCSSSLNRTTFVPDSNIENFNYNPTAPRYIFNNGYYIEDDVMEQYTYLIQDTLRKHTSNLIKYPGIVRKRY